MLSVAAFTGWLQGVRLQHNSREANAIHRKSSIYKPNLHRQLTCSPDNNRAGLPPLHRSSVVKGWL